MKSCIYTASFLAYHFENEACQKRIEQSQWELYVLQSAHMWLHYGESFVIYQFLKLELTTMICQSGN